MKSVIDNKIFQKLKIEDQVLQVESLWDSISDRVKELPVPVSHQRELNRRKQEAMKNPAKLLSLDEFMGRIGKWL